jgi:hypothetical protein
MCALLFKGVAVPLRACVLLSCCAPAAAPNPIRCLPEMVRPPRPADEGASKNVFKVALFKMIYFYFFSCADLQMLFTQAIHCDCTHQAAQHTAANLFFEAGSRNRTVFCYLAGFCPIQL